MALNLDAIGQKIGPVTKDYTWKDVVLYALGVGAGFDELEYVYEDRLKVIPSFAIGGIFDFLAEVGMKSNADLSGILHGEQDIIFHSPIPTEGRLITTGAITAMYDKGADKGALVVAEADTFHHKGQKLFTNLFTLFGRKDGGFGGDPGPAEEVEFPDREPDFVEHARPPADQPLLYRLSGDVFALHIDPDFAKRSGFDKPIMHGLCTHGYACRAVIKHLFPGRPERMTRFRVRFSAWLYPGVPLTAQIWKIDDGRAVFRTINDATGDVVLDRGVVEWMSAEEMDRRKKRAGIRFDDRVAVVTGAGAGLGRTYALELAARGAKVVVNDLGGARDGTGAGTRAADEVVDEITKNGGQAVANYDSVATPEGGENIVRTALDAFGRLDILINNAGILRDRSLLKMEPDDWDRVMAVHLDGAYHVTRPAVRAMRRQGYGRIILTSSAAGLYGNFGQTNYSAAKMALIGFMNTLKLEGEKYDILVNTVAPVAGTRLTEDVLPPDLFERSSPEFVTPLVLYLCSDGCQLTGQIYNTGLGYIDRAAVVTSAGVVIGDGRTPPTVEDIHQHFAAIDELNDPAEFRDAMAALTPLLDAFSPKKEAEAAAEGAGGLTVAGVFGGMADAFQPGAAAGVDVVFQFNISGAGGGDWVVSVKDGRIAVDDGTIDQPTTVIKMGDEDFVALIKGELNPMSAFTSGKLRIEGDIMKSQLIDKLFKF
ncbi:MAG: SDR family NAD(P)-dependent oxidoreductase [Proteobacteria bacterium]|nr:SDR family NAD(P)-dependent oxidoreductase [Pseudomonadota bacterium]